MKLKEWYSGKEKKYRIIHTILATVCLGIMGWFDLFSIKWMVLFVIIMVAFENIWRWIRDKKE